MVLWVSCARRPAYGRKGPFFRTSSPFRSMSHLPSPMKETTVLTVTPGADHSGERSGGVMAMLQTEVEPQGTAPVLDAIELLEQLVGRGGRMTTRELDAVLEEVQLPARRYGEFLDVLAERGHEIDDAGEEDDDLD